MDGENAPGGKSNALFASKCQIPVMMIQPVTATIITKIAVERRPTDRMSRYKSPVANRHAPPASSRASVAVITGHKYNAYWANETATDAATSGITRAAPHT